MIENKQDLISVNSDVLSKEITKVLIEKQGLSIRLFDVRSTEGITDFYINATGRSSMHVASLADDVDELIGLRGRQPLRIEGKHGNAWILVDYGDVIVNVFDRESRTFYNFDRRLPEDAEVDIADLVAEVDKKFKVNKEGI